MVQKEISRRKEKVCSLLGALTPSHVELIHKYSTKCVNQAITWLANRWENGHISNGIWESLANKIIFQQKNHFFLNLESGLNPSMFFILIIYRSCCCRCCMYDPNGKTVPLPALVLVLLCEHKPKLFTRPLIMAGSQAGSRLQ